MAKPAYHFFPPSVVGIWTNYNSLGLFVIHVSNMCILVPQSSIVQIEDDQLTMLYKDTISRSELVCNIE
jgi:hypothetical protein